MSESPYTITDQMIEDILDAAFYGGITYWCPTVWVVAEATSNGQFGKPCLSEYLTRNGTLALAEDVLENGNPSDWEWHPLDRARMSSGIRRAARHFGQTPRAFYEDHDADRADVAVQYAVLDDIVYG